jgi:hypothetical protein
LAEDFDHQLLKAAIKHAMNILSERVNYAAQFNSITVIYKFDTELPEWFIHVGLREPKKEQELTD